MVFQQHRSVQAGDVNLDGLDLDISVTKSSDDPLEFEVSTWNLSEASGGKSMKVTSAASNSGGPTGRSRRSASVRSRAQSRRWMEATSATRSKASTSRKVPPTPDPTRTGARRAG
ncbi:hypothetical protein PhiCh1p27 [Natrialba phage PhiCh1]|uniref:Uncharacterized protein n=1 Tax=Natrialba phage PhiCh1 TaxID=114777 RepID=Q8JL30_9CAUD|nr:hypothetical protein PhiCh1p27 [Natrialba phage PhiCh1]AAM88700.1 unknown [Natrialba phage PhiCh1]